MHSHFFSTIMLIKYEDVQALDDKVIFYTSSKCCKKFNKRQIPHRQYEIKLWLFHTAFCINATNTDANQTGDEKVFTGQRTVLMNFLIQG